MENEFRYTRSRKSGKPEEERYVMEIIDKARQRGLDMLDLRDCGLSRLPREILLLKDQIKYIRLGKRGQFSVVGRELNRISDFSLLQEFSRLKKLSLSGLSLQSVKQFVSLVNLEDLDLSGTGLSDIDGIQELVNLQVLDVSKNQLSLVSAVTECQRLKSLDLSHNQISNLFFIEHGTLLSLETLRLSNNIIPKDEYTRLADLHNLQVLEINQSGLYHLEPLTGISGLRELSLKGNKIQNIGMIDAFEGLELIDLSDNQLTNIQPLGKLSGLKTVLLQKNEISRLEPLKANEALEKLNLSQNLVKDLEPLAKLSKLKHLVLDKNPLRSLQPLSSLPSLSFLSLAETETMDITPLAGLTELKFLNLRHNHIQDIRPLRDLFMKKKGRFPIYLAKSSPVALGWAGLYLANNPIENPPKQYLEAGIEAILSYWKQQEKKKTQAEKKQKVNAAKLIIIGNSRVGKSTLSYLLSHKKLPATPLSSTHGLAFSTWTPDWTINRNRLSVNIIDFGGQEYYHDTHHLFFNDRAAYLLLWNPATNMNQKIEIPDQDSDRADLVRHFSVEYWLNAIGIYTGTDFQKFYPSGIDLLDDDIAVTDDFELDEEGEMEDELVDNLPYVEDAEDPYSQTPVLLVQTYADQQGSVFLNMRDLQDKFPQLAGAVSIGMDVEHKYGIGIDLLRLSVKNIFQSLNIGIGHKYEKSWVVIRQYIEEHEKSNFQLMTIREFQAYFRAHSETKASYTEEETRILCITLDYWGCVLYKYKRQELKDVVVVNPQEFTRKVNAVLTEKVRERNGVLPRSQVLEIVDSKEVKAASLLSLLTIFKILYPLPGKGKDPEPLYLAPMYLIERPRYVDLFLTNFVAYYKIRYEGYFHKGILPDCFDRLGKDLYFDEDRYFYWQWGMVLRRGDRIICVEFDDKHLNQILIRMVRKDRENIGQDSFLQDILQAFQWINRLYQYDLELSCDGKDFISRTVLLEQMQLGLTKFALQDRKYDVRDFRFLLTREEDSKPYKRVFVSYSSKDRGCLDKLTSHLHSYKNAGVIEYWNDLLLTEREWNEQIKQEMDRANILIMLLSPDYLSTDYILKQEIPVALQYLNEAMPSKRVFWILLQPCSYGLFPEISKYTIYPIKEKDEISGTARQKAVSEHENQDREWVKLLGQILDETE